MIAYFKHIAEVIHRNFPQVTHSAWPAIIDEDGRILKQVDPGRNEFEWAGIDDAIKEYFYIRHRDGGIVKWEPQVAGDKRFTSCSPTTSMNEVLELRLVLSVCGFDRYKLTQMGMDALLHSACMAFTIRPIQAITDTITLVKDEFPKPKQFSPDIQMVGIDFDLVVAKNYI